MALRHGLTEVACIGTHIGQSLLNLAARARNGVGNLVPVLGLQFSGPVDLDECQAQALVRVSRTARHRVEVASSLRKTVKAVHTVCGELARDALNVREVIDGAVGVLLSGCAEALNGRIIDAGEPQRVRKFIRCIGGRDCLGRETTDTDSRTQEREGA